MKSEIYREYHQIKDYTENELNFSEHSNKRWIRNGFLQKNLTGLRRLRTSKHNKKQIKKLRRMMGI